MQFNYQTQDIRVLILDCENSLTLAQELNFCEYFFDVISHGQINTYEHESGVRFIQKIVIAVARTNAKIEELTSTPPYTRDAIISDFSEFCTKYNITLI